MAQVVIAAVALALVASTQPPKAAPTQEAPIIVLRRSATARFEPTAGRRVLFALIIGSDVREGDPNGGRADSLHLLGVDTATGAGTIIGFPRDSWVPIPGHGTGKINSALSSGGPDLLVQTVTQLTGIPIQYWALIEFSRFRKLVDALGGVVVNVPYEMHDSFSGANFAAGPSNMDGVKALAFSRNRHAARLGDFGRSENQGRFLLAALGKFRADARDPFKLGRYFGAFHDFVASNVSVKELIDLASIGRRMDPAKVSNVVVNGHTGAAGGQSVVILTPGDLFQRVRDDARL